MKRSKQLTVRHCQSNLSFSSRIVKLITYKMEKERTAILKIIKQNKDILFGRFSAKLTHEDKEKKWKEVAMLAHFFGVLDKSKNWRYCRDVVWQNWRKRTIDKVEKQKKFESLSLKRLKLDENDLMILEIIGYDSSEGFRFRRIKREADSKPKIRVISEAQLKEKPQKRIEGDKQELENHILIMNLEILKREAYLKDLDIYRKEMELGLPASEYTKKFYMIPK